MTYSFTLTSLPPSIAEEFLKVRLLANEKAYRLNVLQNKNDVGAKPDLFSSLMGDAKLKEDVPLTYVEGQVIWATENPVLKVHFNDAVTVDQFEHIVPRVTKSGEEQKKRVKAKAEVFTPSWVCNLQNNLIDGAVLYEGAFNVAEDKSWVGTKKKVRFKASYPWYKYVAEKRIEFTMGEAPYLVSPYDATTGLEIPVRDEKGRWQRIGLLDRKLRVLSENVTDEQTWVEAAVYAYKATFGYEWQGDNLLLARLNLLNTYGHYKEALGFKPPTLAEWERIARIISWNLWQMDGLKMVQPDSCSNECEACKKKLRAGHDGKPIVFLMGGEKKTFEELLPKEWFPTI